VRKHFAFVVALCLFAASAIAWASAQQGRPGSQPMTPIEELLQAVRSDLIDNHADIMAKNLMLTSEQAAKFWPMYAAYQREQAAILDQQLKGVQQFIERFDTLDDAAAMGLINAHFGRDADMAALRQKWLGEFQKVLGTRLAVRAMQVDRRVSLAQQLQMTTKIPLVN
jgi:Spy/CpxP family protein refolding chaperone